MSRKPKQIEQRIVTPSTEAIKALGNRTRREMVSFFPLNPMVIERRIAKQKVEIMKAMAEMTTSARLLFIKQKKQIDFVEDKTGYKLYIVNCVSCGEKMAKVWATDGQLTDWCDLHYLSWYDKDSWHGCLTVNVSPIDGLLGFECACGEDTRDFRGRNSLPPIQKQLMVEYVLKHRKFEHPHSKFIATEANI